MAHVLHSFDRTASSISFHLWINVSFVVLFFGGGDGRQLLRPMRFVNMEIWYAIPWRKRCARVHACIVKVDGILTTRSNASITTNNEIIHKRKRIIKCLSFATLLRFFCATLRTTAAFRSISLDNFPSNKQRHIYSVSHSCGWTKLASYANRERNVEAYRRPPH